MKDDKSAAERLTILEEAIARRRSLGLARLSDEPVDRSIVERMLAAANWAPSHGDTEPWRFSIFSGEGRAVLADAYQKAYRKMTGAECDEAKAQSYWQRAFSAPIWIGIGMQPGLRPDGELRQKPEEELMAVACAVQNLHLVASAAGLVGMWHSKGVSIHPHVASLLGLEPPSRLLGFFFCGWPKVPWPEGERGPIEDKVRWFG